MTLFYEFLWTKGMSPRVALQRAQLALYHHPDQIPRWATGRGVALIPDEASSEGAAAPDRAPTKAWAAFMVSGAE